MNSKSKQASFCATLAVKLANNVEIYEKDGCRHYGYDPAPSVGANKTAIKADIARLRRELLVLEKEMETR